MEKGAFKEQAETVALCVDLDGTLVYTNTLHEAFLATVADIHTLLAVPLWLWTGKARLKQELARRARIDPTLLPYNERLLTYLREQKCAGRYLVLVTAADRSIAEAVNAHLGLFDEIIASDGNRNLRGAEKARALVERFGVRGFSYAGNDRTDLAVWREAASAVLVNAPARVARTATAVLPVDLRIDKQKTWGIALLKALRPYQWVKNLLVFVPIITANAFSDLASWFQAILLFMAFCAVASSIYLLNDLTDLEADRQHPRKKTRPFANGMLSIAVGAALVPVLFFVGLFLVGMSGAIWLLLLYTIISIAYSLWLKEFPLVDVFVLASLYTLRLFAGGEATGHPVSLWLLAFSSFFFLSLAIMKRASELMVQQNKVQILARRGYMPGDLQILFLMGVSASFASALVLALYVQSPEITTRYVRPTFLWGLVPSVLFWQCRVWLATSRGYMHDDPIVYAAKDWVSQIIVGCLILILLLASASL
jgi:4-hydroxybenzoate polyprenyltransferase